MGVVRNFIDIIGISPEDQLPKENRWQTIVLSESDCLFLPEERGEIDTIFQIMLAMEIKPSRIINLPIGRIQIIDGYKKFKIIYSGTEKQGQANIIDLRIPFNTFIELPGNEETSNISIFVLDAYFEPIDKRKIYYNLTYMLDAQNAGINKKITVKAEDEKAHVIYNNNIKSYEKLQSIDHKEYITNKDINPEQDKKGLVDHPIYTESAISIIEDNTVSDIDAEYL